MIRVGAKLCRKVGQSCPALVYTICLLYYILLTCFCVSQVGLWKSHSKHKPEGGCFIAHQRRTAQKPNISGNLKDIQSFLREVELIRNSRDVQIEEAMFFNQKLEQELRVSRETVLMLEECNRTLKKEQVEMRKRVEEARQAVLSGLKKVKELEAKASHVPVLQRHVEQLEMELLYYRLV